MKSRPVSRRRAGRSPSGHAIAAAAALLFASGTQPALGSPESDARAARALFERNLDAIRDKDREEYLSLYLHSENLARNGPGGLLLGYEAHEASSTDAPWPDLFEGHDLRVVPIVPGVVYGSYRYRVKYGADESAGISERLFIETPDGWRIAMTSAFEAPPGTPPPPRALIGATLIDGTGRPPRANAVVILRNGRIDCVGSRLDCPVPDGIEVLNLSGFWITPGLIDAHVHFSQTGWADGRPDAMDLRDVHPYENVIASLREDPERWFDAYLCSGVTAVNDVGGYSWTLGLPERAEGDTSAPRIAAAGPLLSTVDHWINLPGEKQLIHITDPETARQTARYVAAAGAEAIKVWFIVPQGTDEPSLSAMSEAVRAAGDEARRLGVPLIVHATGLAEAKVALEAGAHLLVHSVFDAPVDDAFIDLARRRETVYCPTLIVSRGYQRMYRAARTGRPPAVDDEQGCVDAVTLAHLDETIEYTERAPSAEQLDGRENRLEERERIMAENLRRVHEAGITVAMGTDAGNPLTLHGVSVHAEMEAMQAAGMPPLDVLTASTLGSAKAMGRAEDLGTVETGKLADLLILSADPTLSIRAMRSIQFVVRGGELRSIEELGRANVDAE